MHDGKETVFSEIGNLGGLGVGKQPLNFIRIRHHLRRRVWDHQGVNFAVLEHGADFLTCCNVLNRDPVLRIERYRLFVGHHPLDLTPWNLVFRLQIAFGQH